MRLQPLGANVLIRRDPEVTVSPGGIIYAFTEKPVEGEVLAVGLGRVLENGSIHPMSVKVGDHVLFAKFSGAEITNDPATGVMVLIMDEKTILGTIIDE